MSKTQSNEQPPNPSGLCQCGCGEPTPIAKRTDKRAGRIAGHPVRFLRGHHRRIIDRPPPNPGGRCLCGCGELTPLATCTSRQRGLIKGQPVRFAVGHGKRIKTRWIAEDRGYETACHIWQLALDKQGYGWDCVDSQTMRAPRASWLRAHGAIPDGLVICHTCDQPSCVNVDHLFLGTVADNVADCVAKKRHSRGETHPSAKLTKTDVASIRALEGRMRQMDIAAKFGVTPDHVRMIQRGLVWRG